MIIGMLILSILVLLVILINRALRSSSKSCEFNLEVNIKGFKINFKTTEKNAPSSND
ncbi:MULTISPECIES: hypothetical protein [Clostridium]|uniref:hypothetical protein n=1 Tax=Clostridium TaxID=1485 RepID=UPI0012E6A7D8|nr:MULTISPECIES: hypothetical protein [Clostridium]MBS4783845.1 hypothetical protein [Clostridium sp.]CAI3193034.1 conserved hypothetical protein [Clostridium neonatale]CAI3217334.1 conserved hypothetical protein [Clostridium neonatale]CAI3246745.1 conserved hypothetical protein [Clostridium neonatale]CAI3557222.1 conserved hypothetical protein [Clostridium neonatale]